MAPPLVQVLILNYNGKKYLRKCVESVLASQGARYGVLVADNGSTDNSLDDLPVDPRLEILRNGENLYFAKGNNRGIEHILKRAEQTQDGPKYVFILNNDTEIHPLCLRRLTEFMEQTPEAAGCQPILLFQSNPAYVNSRGCRVSLSGRTWDAGFSEPHTPSERPEKVLGITGGAMFLRTDILRRVGGFCEYFSMYSEDVDLSLRIRSGGASLWCVPQALVLHAYGGTAIASMPSKRLFYCERNGIYLVLRNFPLSKVFKSFVLCTPLRLLIALNALRQGRFRYAWAVLAATGAGLAALPWFVARRLLSREKRDYGFWPEVDEDRLIPPKPKPVPPGDGTPAWEKESGA